MSYYDYPEVRDSMGPQQINQFNPQHNNMMPQPARRSSQALVRERQAYPSQNIPSYPPPQGKLKLIIGILRFTETTTSSISELMH